VREAKTNRRYADKLVVGKDFIQPYTTHLIVMLGGGDKNSQPADIVAAKSLAANLEE
jgi:hypothetical protein